MIKETPSPNRAIKHTVIERKTMPGIRTNFLPILSDKYPINGVETIPTATSNPKWTPLDKLDIPKSELKYEGRKVISAMNAIPLTPLTNVMPQINGSFKTFRVSFDQVTSLVFPFLVLVLPMSLKTQYTRKAIKRGTTA